MNKYESKTHIYKDEFTLYPDKWVPIDPNDEDDNRMLKQRDSFGRPVITKDCVSQIIQWDTLTVNDKVYIDLSGSNDNSIPIIDKVDALTAYHCLRTAWGGNGYIKLYAKEPIDRELSIIGFFTRNSEE